MAKIDSFFCDECGSGVFYVLSTEDNKILLLCRNCAVISELPDEPKKEV